MRLVVLGLWLLVAWWFGLALMGVKWVDYCSLPLLCSMLCKFQWGLLFAARGVDCFVVIEDFDVLRYEVLVNGECD